LASSGPPAEDPKALTEGAPIVVKKIMPSHGGAHGGAWKIALADMMTAMILNSSVTR